MNAQPMLALASGVLPEATPLRMVQAAAAAGFEAVGIWVEPDRWTAQTTRDVRHALEDGGLHLLDAEVLWIKPGPTNPAHLRALDIAAELRAANVLVVSSDPDESATVAKFVQLCEHVRGAKLRVALEFGAFTDVPRLETALRILRLAGQPNQALLVDALHLQRSGGRPADLASVPTEWLCYAQLCDAPLAGPIAADRAAIREEAVDRRVCPGEGELPLDALLQALPPGLPLSLEIRSKALRTELPDFAERARVVLERTRLWLNRARSQACQRGLRHPANQT